MLIKEYLYDWQGINYKIFEIINTFFAKFSNDFIINIFDKLAAIKNFYFYIIIILLVKAYYIIKYKNDNNLLNSQLFKWSEVFFVLNISYFINMTIAAILKYGLKFSRPFCNELVKNIHIIKNSSNYNCHTSFPSGHTMVATILITAFWPNLNIYGRILGIVLLISTGLSRISAGLHFPADVTYGFIISFSITYLIRKFFSKKFLYLYNYIKTYISS